MGAYVVRIAGPAVTKANLELVTLSELKIFLDKEGETADDNRMQQVVDGVNRAAYHRMRERFIKHNSTNWDLVLDGSWDGWLLALPYRPIAAFTSIARGYYSAGGWVSDYVYPTSEYVRDDEAALLHNVYDGWPSGKQTLRVVYQAGFTAAPEDVKHALLQWMSIEWRRAAGERLDQTSESDESGATSYTFTTIPGSAAAVFERYANKGGLI